MKRIAILLGFCYLDKINELPGIIIDIYLMYKHLNSLGYDVFVITDVPRKMDVNIVNNIAYNELDSNVISFIEKYDKYIISTTSTYILNTIKNINMANSNNFVFYYTGHFKDGKIVCPDDFGLNLINFTKMILENIGEFPSSIWIFDCCHFSGINLRFEYSNGIFKYIKGAIDIANDIVFISSSKENEVSEATTDGSKFTRKLVESFSKGIQTYRSLVNITGGYIKSSKPLTNQINLCINNKKLQIKIVKDLYLLIDD